MEQKEKRYTVKWQPKDDIYGITFTGMTDEVDIFDYEDGKRFCASFVVENGRHHTITQHNADWLKIFDHARNEVICYPKKEDEKESTSKKKKRPFTFTIIGSISMMETIKSLERGLRVLFPDCNVHTPDPNNGKDRSTFEIDRRFINCIEDADLILVIPKEEFPIGYLEYHYGFGESVTYEMALANYLEKPIMVAPSLNFKKIKRYELERDLNRSAEELQARSNSKYSISWEPIENPTNDTFYKETDRIVVGHEFGEGNMTFEFTEKPLGGYYYYLKMSECKWIKIMNHETKKETVYGELKKKIEEDK